MKIILIPLLELISMVIHLYIWAVIGSVILSWLIVFNVVNTHNRFISMVSEALYRLTEPVLSLIRRMLPNLGGLDFSPLILILALYSLQRMVDLLTLRVMSF